MSEPTAAQSGTLDLLAEQYGEEHEIAAVDGGWVFRTDGQELLIAEDGAVTELETSAPGGTPEPEAASPSPEAVQQDGAEAHSEDTSTSASAPPATFPVKSLKDAARHLRQPFTDKAVKWKVQATVGQGKGLVVPYIDARLATERLNAVCPHLWFDEYEPVSGGQGLLCRLTVDGVTRIDVGSGYVGKGLYSDAFKRAAVKFGIGVSLYALPKIFLEVKAGFLSSKMVKDKRTGREKEQLTLTDKGIERCMSGYRAWLKESGEAAFGEPLDHGDVFGSYGEVIDAEQQAPAVDVPEEPAALDNPAAKALTERAKELQKKIPAKDLPKAQFNRELAGASSSLEDLTKLVERLEGLAK